jgi:hypothetical protein
MKQSTPVGRRTFASNLLQHVRHRRRAALVLCSCPQAKSLRTFAHQRTALPRTQATCRLWASSAEVAYKPDIRLAANPSCRFHQDSAKRHGPYHYWTRKVKGRTVTVLLKQEQVRLYREWIQNNRRLEDLVQEMRRISESGLS